MKLKRYGLVAAGELLADLIGSEFRDSLLDTEHYHRFPGGSPANLAANLARLGHSAALIASVGDDNLGQYLTTEVARTGVDISGVATDASHPTSLVLVSRTQGTPDFIAYRAADCQLHPHHFPDHLLAETTLFHTTCFALSREPARSNLLEAARRARQLGARVSLDANYAPALWPDRQQAQRVIAEYIQEGLVKLSQDDALRLFGQPVEDELVLNFFHGHGAELVCYTLGAGGSILSWEGGRQQQRIPVEPVEVKDATGAGDAYWSGFLSALLDGHSPEQCARAGTRMAALKLGTEGVLPVRVGREYLYQE
ncbi:carbohydrate kinase [Telluribacter sp.]|jgi:fructokinase|uniref:carbohydrate kinase family protein n=1 Tax=Telluribacter sp. TaxID=1978767 RepID=UPI002E0EE51C|nr:carbohydrate kinase [Telluribacter sp.]